MNVVDSSGWLEYLTDGTNAGLFAPIIEERGQLVVPSIAMYEVMRWVLHNRNEDFAIRSVSEMACSHVVELDGNLAIAAARLARRHRLAMADAIILATACHFEAILWTQDADFDGIEGVRYIPRAA